MYQSVTCMAFMFDSSLKIQKFKIFTCLLSVSCTRPGAYYSLVQFCGQMLRNTLWVDFTPGNLTGNPVTATLNTTHAPNAPTAGQTQEGWQQTKTKSFSRPWIQRITLFYYYFFSSFKIQQSNIYIYIYIYISYIFKKPRACLCLQILRFSKY